MAIRPVVEIYRPHMPYKAVVQLRMNIELLLNRRREEQKALAAHMGRHPTTLNKFLKGTREIQMVDLDKIADFFGLATYQLFQPGIAPLTERRKVRDRRTGIDRRISRRMDTDLHYDEGTPVAGPKRSTGVWADGASIEVVAQIAAIAASLTDLSQTLAARATDAGRDRQTPSARPHKAGGR